MLPQHFGGEVGRKCAPAVRTPQRLVFGAEEAARAHGNPCGGGVCGTWGRGGRRTQTGGQNSSCKRPGQAPGGLWCAGWTLRGHPSQKAPRSYTLCSLRGPGAVPSPRARRRGRGPACGCGARACACRRRRGPGFAGGRSCISSAVHRSVLLALSPSDPSRSSAGRPTGSERSPAGTPLLTSSCWDPATFPAKPGFIMCLCSAAPAAGSGGGEPATTKKTGARGRLAGGPAPAGARRSRGAAAAAAAREDGSPAAAASSSSSSSSATAAAASPLPEPLAHGGS